MGLVLIISLIGFVNASVLYWQYRRHVRLGKKMFCFLGGDCGEVVASKFGRTLGIKNELIGLVYYGSIGLYALLGRDSVFIVKAVAGIIALLSLYLLFAQTVLLRKFCSWCILAIAINWLLFYLLVF